MNYWLLKTEPKTYSIDQLQKDKKTNWNNVRNYQARNFLKQVKKSDLALIYHSGDDKAVVGLAKVVREYYRDYDKEDPETEWVQIDIEFVKKFKNPISLKEIKANKSFDGMILVKQARLSVMPVEKKHFDLFEKLSQ